MQERIIQETSSGCRMISTAAFPPELFGDGVHLNERGADMFTRQMGELLMGTPRDAR